jgi:hypothetical protein
LTTSSGTVSLKGSAGVTVGHNITTTTGAVSVTGAGINLTSGKTIDAGSSTITLDGNDGAITLTGALTTTNNTSAAIIIKDASTLSLGNITTGATGFVTLGGATTDNLTGAVTQTGVINTGTLIGNTASDVTLLGVNTIANLGVFTSTGTDGFSLNDLGGLTVSGNVNNTSGAVSIVTTVSPLTISADITATSQSLTLTGVGINQTTGTILAAGLTVNAGAGSIALTQANNNFTGTVSLNNSGANNVAINDANALDFGSSTLGSGSLTVTAVGITQSGAITVVGNSSFNAGAGVITLTDLGNNFTGSVSLSNSGNNNVDITGLNAIDFGLSSLGSGTFTVTAVGITQTGAITQASGAGTSSFNAGAGVITLANAGNNFTGAVSLNNSGANNVAITDVNAIDFGASTLGSGTFTVTAVGITQSGAITQASSAGAVTFNAGAGVITLTQSNDFTGAVTLNSTGATVAITDTNAIDFGASTLGSGSFTVTAVGITQTGAITQASSAGTVTFNAGAGVITLANASNDFTGSVALNSTGATVAITDTNALALASPNLGANTGITAIAGTTLTLPAFNFSTGTGNIDFQSASGTLATNGTLTSSSGTVSLKGSAGVTVGHNITTTSGSVSVIGAGINLTSGNTIDAGSSTITLDGKDGAITLTGALTTTNNTSAAIVIQNASTVSLGDITTGATGFVTLGGATTDNLTGAVTQTGVITTGTLVGNTAGDVTLLGANTITNLGTFTSTGTGGFSLNDLGGLTVSGNVNNTSGAVSIVTTVSPLTISADITATSQSLTLTGVGINQTTGTILAAGLTVNAGAGSIALNQANNNFTGSVSLNNSGANNVAITDVNAIDFGTSTLGTGTLTVTAVGITQSGGAITAAGTSSFNAGTGVITLTQSNDFTGSVRLNNSGANNVAITDVNAIDFGASTLGSGSFAVTAVGITQIGAITQASSAGTVTFNAGAGVITLANASNDFTGSVALNNSGANNVAITDVNAIDFGTSTLGSGSFTVTAVGITQSGAITQASSAGAATFNAGTGVITLANASNNFTGSVRLNNSGANNVAITDVNAIDFGASTLGSGSFAVTAVGITQIGAVVQASSAGTVTFNAGAGVITLANASNDFTGSVALNNSGANNVAITDVNAIDFGTSTLGSGSFTVTAAGITQSGAITQASSGCAATFNAGSGVITLANASNHFTGSVRLNNSGANNVAITDVNAIDFGTSTLGSGSFAVTAVGITQIGAITQASSAGVVTFNAGAGVITLANVSNDFTGSVALNNSGANNVAITDTNAIDFGASNLGSGTFTVTAFGITQSGAITQASSAGTVTFNAGAGVITLANASNDFTGAVSLNNSGANNVAITDVNAIDFAASVLGSGTFTVTAVGITQSGAITQASSAGAVTFNAGAGVITLINTSNDFAGAVSLNNSGANNVAITDANALDFGSSTLGSGSFSVTAVGITQSGAITQASSAGTVTFSAGAGIITLSNAGNNFTGAVSLNNSGANNVAIRDVSAIGFGASTLGSGSFTVTAVGITQSGAITAAGTTSFNAGAGVITLANAGNNFTGAVSLNNSGANNVAITDVNAIDFGASTLGSGSFTVTAVGITQSGAITQASSAGTVTINAGTGVITLSNAGNNFTGAVSLNNSGANNVAITDVNGIDFGSSTLGSGSFTVTAVGITQSGAIIQASSAGAVTFNAGAGVITLTQSNDFTGSVTLNSTGATIAITDMNAIDFAASVLGSGTFTVNAVGITQSGAITQASSAGAVTFNAGAGVITLTQSNDFAGAVTLNSTGATVAITDINAIDFANSTLGSGSFTVTAVGITQSGAITQASSASTVTFNAGAGVITLANASNDFTGSVALNSTGATVAIRDSNAIDFGASALGSGTFTVTAVGIMQSGAITAAGATSFNAGAGVITLANAGNNFTGAVSLNNSGANNVAIRDSNAIDFGASTLGSGTFTVTAVGITQSGAIIVAGTSSFNAGTGVITLTQSNDFTGSVTLNSTGATVAIRDVNALDFSSSTLGSGSFTVTAVGITQTGAITVAGPSSFDAGAGVITLTNASNDFTGSVALNNSGNNNVSVQDSTDLTMGLSNIGSGILNLNAGSSGSIRLTSNVTSLNGLQNYNSPIVLTSNVDINAGTGDINLPNTISGNFSLTPMTSGSGLTTISGANTNTTTNVTTGVVQINNSSPQTTNFVVSGGTLKGTGAIGNLTATGTGIIAPGNSPGQVTTTNLSLSSTNTLQIEIIGANSSPVAGTDYDQIVIGSGGTVILGSAILNLSSTYTGNAGTVFTIIDNQDPTTAIQGTFAGLSEGAAVSVNGRAYQISYVGGTGNDVTLTILNSPTITSFNPTAGNAGTSVVITGSDFINVSQVSFNGTAQPTYTVNSPTQITTTIPSGATTGTISITTIAGTATSSNSITIDNTAPTLSISASPGSLKANETSTITFTFSEVVTGFSSSIITVTNGTITNPVASSSTVYTATFTPTLGIKADGTVSVSNNYFDSLGNQGTASTLTPPIAINTVQTPLVTGSASTSQSGASVVSLINPDTGEVIGSAAPFPDFTGQIRVVSGDFNGDGKVDILAAAGPGGGPAVAILDSETGEVMESFFAFDPAFTGGVFIAVRDFNGDGILDIIAGAGAGGGPEVRIFNGNGLTVIRSFFAYAEDFTGGVSVANIDFNGDGVLDLVTGAGPGGAPVVAVWDPYTGALLAQFMAYAEDFSGGVRVGVSDGNFDGILDLVTGAGPGGGPEVKGFSFPTLDLLFSFFSGDPTNTGGVFVS